MAEEELDLKVPALQEVQAEDPAADNDPEGQAVH
jgi:hypothetical protein